MTDVGAGCAASCSQIRTTGTTTSGEKERALWHPVPRNRLIAYRDGRIVRTSKPHGYVFCEAILELRKVYPEIMSSAEKVAEHA